MCILLRGDALDLREVLDEVKALGNERSREGMARYGINTERAYGVSVSQLRRIAKRVGKDHQLALELWDTGIHEGKLLAALIDDPSEVTESQMEKWVRDFDSWDVVDIVCANLFDSTPWAHRKALEWTRKEGQFQKRAGYALMAALAVHDKYASNSTFERFYPAIKRGAVDERNYVRKSVNWALRQIGKRNQELNASAIEIAKEISKLDSRAARWIASDALRELQGEAVQDRLKKRARMRARPRSRPSDRSRGSSRRPQT